MLTTKEKQQDAEIWVGVITLFPEMFQAITGSGITRRAVESGILNLDLWNPRDFSTDKHRTVDDKPYGGGPGMLMKVEPLLAAIQAAKAEAAKYSELPCKVIYLSPQGKRLDQAAATSLAESKQLILVAGRYEGIDERLVDREIDEEYSIGDYVLSGGELPAMVLIDSMVRLQPGAVGDKESVIEDSFVDGLLDHPHYTRPEVVDGVRVPDVLLSGNHKAISRWRLKQRLGRTFERRPELIDALELDEDLQNLLNEYQNDLVQKRELEE